jgi:DNA topoisomerase I
MKLVIVESPTKARTLSRYLGRDYTIKASMGHVSDLPKKNLGVEIENDFKPEYVVVPGKQKIIDDLKKTADSSKQVVLATDPDREGEAIAFHVARLLNHKDTARIVFHEITKSAIQAAINEPGTINKSRFEAQQARRILDRLVGYKLSPLLWRKVRRGLSAGRVQSPAVRLIVEREREIKDFKPQEYWQIEAELKTKAQKKFIARLFKLDNKKPEIKSKKQADEVIKDLKKADYIVISVKTRQVQRSPNPPFITSTLQRTGSSLFRWSAKRTMREAQRLYENGLITYHRTDSVHLASKAVSKARKYIEDTFGGQYVPENPRFYKVKSKLAQEAHEAIRASRINYPQEKIKAKLGFSALKLYQLIFKRYIASQMKNQIMEKNTVDIEAGKYLFRAQGETEIFKGFMRIYKKQAEAIQLPELNEQDKLDLVKVMPEQKFTQPPPRYTEGSLIKALEQKGIGRPSTYAPIISTIQKRQYVEKTEGVFRPTPVGETVVGFLLTYFQSVVDYDFTAKMEDSLDEVAQKNLDWVELLKDFYRPFEKKLEKVAKTAKRQKIEAEKIGKKCPKCKQGEQVIRVGRFGKFLSCSRFPDCDWKGVYIEKLKGIKCPQDGGDIVIRKTKKGKRFFGCSNWPKCKWASWRKPTLATAKQK